MPVYHTRVLSDDDRAWCKALQAELWPQKDTYTPLERNVATAFGKPLPDPPKAREQVTREELARALSLIDKGPLIVGLYCSGMFGGIGITLYEHEVFIGTGVEELLSISEQVVPRLDVRTVYEHMKGEPPKYKEKTPGDCREDCYDLFTKIAFTPQNVEWCKRYKIELRRDRVHYCY